MRRSDFHFDLPNELIAQYPLQSRSASRLLCLDGVTGAIADRKFKQLIELVSPGDLFVFNNTRVIPARLFARKETGGKVEILVERIIDDNNVLACLRASKTPQPLSVLTIAGQVQVQVLGREGDLFRLSFGAKQSVMEVLHKHGQVPLPPYIARTNNGETSNTCETDKVRYQTVYAQNDGAVAAPTAGLHFDNKMLSDLQQSGVASAFVTLHVGAGTFQPVRVENIEDHCMHSEYIEIDQSVCDLVKQTHNRGGRVIAVGTTSMRCLESAAMGGEIAPYRGDTRIFIYPGVPINVTDALVTNFHLSESTLLMLVSALAGRENIFKAYEHAIRQRYRFFSYGDAMFISRRATHEN
ncbi:MAG: tRNA preQ1(34) S-adenosylmethionine ribosyltransferase-isomerase QueA [Gammaproteobacteria bacterium]|nr:tRNA preQ1(34) S-adenosylmethionine ribosyltransferase-isomerase QueA [Gammaproteobacteria bacterium]